MNALKLVVRNALRHRLRIGSRSFVTLAWLGAVLAVRTAAGSCAWTHGMRGAAAPPGRAWSCAIPFPLVFSLPVSYENRIRGVDGVSAVARSNWFGGIYQEPKNFFPQFAVSDNYLSLYPEFALPDEQ
ncbi:MAG: hypothetical protein IPP85_18900 [Propionivibrio sp.]|nr:hypothetical protein [Propionivibrio sp.]